MRVLVTLLFVVVMVAGCATPEPAPPSADASHRFTGDFDAQAGQAERERAQGIAATYGGTVAFLESFPEQFVFSGLTEAACAKARDAMRAQPHVASVGECFAG